MNSRKETESQAEKYVKKGKFNEAISEYKTLLTDGEEDIPIRNIIGDLYVKAGQEEMAAQEFRQIARHYEEKKIFAKSIALYKRITRLDPNDYTSAEKLAELLSFQGYISEAKDEYKRLAKKYVAANENQNAMKMYRFLINLDHGDEDSRLALVDIYEKEDLIEQAVEQLNVLAELKIHGEKFKEARELLDRARNIDIDHTRTLFNLIGLLKRDKKDNEALSLVKNILGKDEQNINALRIYGNLLLRKNDYKKAEDIFSKILEINPNEINARIKLGTIHIYEKNYDEAFEIFEPLVDSFLKRNKEDKAVSLLGLILRTKVIHVPTLEKIAKVYEIKNQPEKLRLVYRILLNQYKKEDNKERALDILRRMVSVFPENDVYYREYKKIRKDMGISEEDDEEVESIFQQRDAQLTLEESLSQADLYIQQGLFRIAKRFLESLRLDFPEEPIIQRKLEEIKETSSDSDRDKISEKMEIITEKQAEIKKISEDKEKEEQEKEEKEPKDKEKEKAEQKDKEREEKEQRDKEKEEQEQKEKEKEKAEQEDKKREEKEQKDKEKEEQEQKEKERENKEREEKEQKEKEKEKEEQKDKEREEKEKDEKDKEDKVTEDIEKDKKQGEGIVLEESAQEEEIVPEEDLVSVAHIFADTDIIPFSSPEDETVDFFDLAERINEELEAIEDVMSLQKERISSTSEKPLQEIIKEFRKDFSERMHEASDESRYNLGIAFMEQGLYDEAIDEFKLASRESFLTVDCFLSISFCFQSKKNYGEAIKWVQKAMDISEKDSTQFYSLKYELASLFEAMGEYLKAMQTFIEVKEWKSDFRDVGQRLKNVATKIK